MKNFILFFIVFLHTLTIFSQTDSLAGFNEQDAKQKAVSEGLSGADRLRHSQFLKRSFINQKYNLPLAPSVENYRPSQPAACNNEDFESSSSGTIILMNQVNGWTISRGITNSSISICNITSCCPSNPVESEIIHIPPGGYSDTTIGQVYRVFSVFGTNTVNSAQAATTNTHLSLPMRGDKVLKLNSKKVADWSVERATKTFTVTNTNNIFSYAFMVVMYGAHSCCDAGAIAVKFTNLTTSAVLSSQNYSLIGVTSMCNIPPPIPFYHVGSGATFTANTFSDQMFSKWNVVNVNLQPYVGQVIQMEVIAADCNAGGHFSYVYFDAECGYVEPLINGLPVDTGCVKPATISLNTTLNSYLWTGPGGFTTSASSFTTITQGVYTLTSVQSASLPVLSQTVLVKFHVPTINIIASNTLICFGHSVSVQAGGLSTYTWSNFYNTSGFTITPLSNMVYSVSGHDANGCEGTANIEVKVTDCTGLSDNSILDKTILFPNPNNGEFNLRIEEINLPATLTVYDLQGKLLYSQKIKTHNEVIHPGKLSAGKYLYRVNATGNNFTGYFVVE